MGRMPDLGTHPILPPAFRRLLEPTHSDRRASSPIFHFSNSPIGGEIPPPARGIGSGRAKSSLRLVRRSSRARRIVADDLPVLWPERVRVRSIGRRAPTV